MLSHAIRTQAKLELTGPAENDAAISHSIPLAQAEILSHGCCVMCLPAWISKSAMTQGDVKGALTKLEGVVMC
jgi:hypothetical protein